LAGPEPVEVEDPALAGGGAGGQQVAPGGPGRAGDGADDGVVVEPVALLPGLGLVTPAPDADGAVLAPGDDDRVVPLADGDAGDLVEVALEDGHGRLGPGGLDDDPELGGGLLQQLAALVGAAVVGAGARLVEQELA